MMPEIFPFSCKPMKYYRNRLNPIEVLFTGKYMDYTFVILNMGTHPTAYVKIPKTHPFFGKDYDYCNPLHGFGGGPFTFSDSSANFANFLDTPIPSGWYLGWDYYHINDYNIFSNTGKKWTTEEIFEDCRHAIEWITINESRERV